MSVDDTAKHADDHALLYHRFGYAVKESVKPMRLAHVRHDALAGLEPSQDLEVALFPIRLDNALFERGDGYVGHTERRAFVP